MGVKFEMKKVIRKQIENYSTFMFSDCIKFNINLFNM